MSLASRLAVKVAKEAAEKKAAKSTAKTAPKAAAPALKAPCSWPRPSGPRRRYNLLRCRRDTPTG